MKTQNSPTNKNNKRIKALANLDEQIKRTRNQNDIDRMLDEARTLRKRITSPEQAAQKRTKKRREARNISRAA